MSGNFYVRPFFGAMGAAVAERTILRKDATGAWETWGDVAHRVAVGNTSLVPGTADAERPLLEKHIAKATVLMSGRHLQHGDETQHTRSLEVFSNCASAPMSWLSFGLLLNGSGVGRCFDDDMMVVDWDHSPNLRVVLSSKHKDFNWATDEDVRDARHKYRGKHVIWHKVADTREGWAKAVEVWELLTYQKVYMHYTLVLDFSDVRPRGAPIMGMQGRPSSGPRPLMAALQKLATIKGAGMAPWLQTMYADHYTAECVLVGGARRAARIAVKTWRDKTVLDFIRIKRPVEYDGLSMVEVIAYRKDNKPFAYLWSSNNSVSVDEEFWRGVNFVKDNLTNGHQSRDATELELHAWAVFNAATEAAYADGTGEPGFINVDKLRQNDAGMQDLSDGNYIGSDRYTVNHGTKMVLSRLAEIAQSKPYMMVTNPCGEEVLSVLGALCIIADVVPYHADTIAEAEEAFRVTTRAIMRTNLMDSLFRKEVARTNRIGVGITGIHEFAFKFFGCGFNDLIKPDFGRYFAGMYDQFRGSWHFVPKDIAAAAFWLTLSRFSRAVQEESDIYADYLGLVSPHTVTTIKPAGTTSKLFGLTEGWHLPAMERYLRWVQFRDDDPLVKTYTDAGYPVRELTTYQGTVIVGFPTEPAITALGMGDALVTASNATPQDQYRWLELGEKYWLDGVDIYGDDLHSYGKSRGAQISYTLKWQPSVISYADYQSLILNHQPYVRCCAVLPIEDTSAYEYLPESPVSKIEYEEILRGIIQQQESLDKVHVDCASGGCPIDFKKES